MKNRTKMLVEAGLLIAIAQVLSYIVIFQMPNGGLVTAGSMVPIIIFALRWGFKPGILAGASFGILQFLLGPKHSFHILSLFLDYPIAFGAIGLAGLWRDNLFSISLSVILAIFIRLGSHVISGAVVFYEYAGTQNPWLYSFLYNGSFLGLETLINIGLLALIYVFLKGFLVDQRGV